MVSESFYTGSETVRGFGFGYGYACVCVCVCGRPPAHTYGLPRDGQSR
jgi:hypothetical protein